MWRQVSRVALRANLASRAAQRPFLVSRPAMTNFIKMYSTHPSGLNRDDVEKRIINVFKSFDKITPTANFATDLGLDSLDTVEVIVAVEEEFGIEIPDNESDEIKSIDNAVEYILAQSEGKFPPSAV
ncbi:hypothetical protein TRICI_004251 [Trichomonascus ciferrii]|uniref:Acyl carrier protein n=1 Tax=Trichomonascus ciferrii TaxID=44093 RepID=A0A642V2V8_9ASCO|nr:hypothetical protein TRICI_004251 [Trichomonascus ciferrii]